ncbi:MAG: Zn-ribbon domain-containing OB-fold protein [Solirubrobacteraceae bacterium]
MRLIAGRCRNCGKVAFPRKSVCDRCAGVAEPDPTPLSLTGVLYSFSEVHVAPPGFPVPYAIGYVDFPEDVRVLAQIQGMAAELSVGDRMDVTVGVIRELPDEAICSYRFRKRAAI